MTVTLAQIAPKLAPKNIKTHIEIIDSLAHSDVVVFPELSLNGYLLHDKVYEDAYTLKELQPLIDKSKTIDIVVGVALKHEGGIYNSALYLHKGEVLHMHHKNSLPNYGMFEEARYFFKGQTVDAFETPLGKAMMLVCEDVWRASTIQAVVDARVDIVYVIASSPARGFEDEKLHIAMQWEALLKSTAILAQTTVVFVNRVGFEDGMGFWGGSMVVDLHADITHALKLFEPEIKSINIKQKRYDAQRYIVKY